MEPTSAKKLKFSNGIKLKDPYKYLNLYLNMRQEAPFESSLHVLITHEYEDDNGNSGWDPAEIELASGVDVLRAFSGYPIDVGKYSGSGRNDGILDVIADAFTDVLDAEAEVVIRGAERDTPQLRPDDLVEIQVMINELKVEFVFDRSDSERLFTFT